MQSAIDTASGEFNADSRIPTVPIARHAISILVTVGCLILGIIGYGFYKGDHLSRVYAPLANAAMAIKLEATTAHLWFEEIISGDRHAAIDAVWLHQERAEWYARAMLEGGQNAEGTFVPLHDGQMRLKISEVRGKLREFREIAELRFRHKEASGIGSEIDQRYDRVFEDLLETADGVETRLQEIMARDLASFRKNQVLLICLSVCLMAIIALAVLHYNRRMAAHIRSLRHANTSLEREISIRKEADRRAGRSEGFLSAILDSIQDGITVVDSEFNILRVNRVMECWYPEQRPLEGKKCYAALHGRSEPCTECPTRAAMASGRIEKVESTFTEEVYGGAEEVELVAFPMKGSAEGDGAVIECARNITERKRIMRLVREREELYRSLFEKNRSVMLLIDPVSKEIVDANPAARAFYGYAKEDLTAMRISDINTLPPKELEEELKRAKSEKRSHFNFRHRRADGTISDVEVFAGPITVGGRLLLCSIVHDITHRKRIETEREQLIEELRQALSEVKTLRGFLPICCSCKKIRDDKGYWNQIEAYLHEHSDARLSHGICPECAKILYPEMDIYDE